MNTQAIIHKCFGVKANLLEGGKAMCLISCSYEASLDLLAQKNCIAVKPNNYLRLRKCLLVEFSRCVHSFYVGFHINVMRTFLHFLFSIILAMEISKCSEKSRSFIWINSLIFFLIAILTSKKDSASDYLPLFVVFQARIFVKEKFKCQNISSNTD